MYAVKEVEKEFVEALLSVAEKLPEWQKQLCSICSNRHTCTVREPNTKRLEGLSQKKLPNLVVDVADAIVYVGGEIALMNLKCEALKLNEMIR